MIKNNFAKFAAIFGFFLTSLMATASGPNSEEWTDIQAQVDQAMLRYYHELRSGKGRTYAERVVLWKDIVGPSEQKAQEYQIKTAGEFISQGQSYNTAAKPSVSPSPAKTEPDYELDGSKLPKELSFGRAASPTPDPSKMSR